MEPLQLYYDPISPYVWLATRELTTTFPDRPLEIVPVLFAGLLGAHGNVGPAEVEAKRRYVWVDMTRRCRMRGLTYEGPPAHPFNPLLALRSVAAVADPGQRLTFATALVDRAWKDGGDLTAPEVITEVATDAGLNAPEVLEAAQSPMVKAELRQNTEEAAARGVFGVPTFSAGGELFWGVDSIPMVQAYLKGDLTIDFDAIAHQLSRPRGADRRPPSAPSQQPGAR